MLGLAKRVKVRRPSYCRYLRVTRFYGWVTIALVVRVCMLFGVLFTIHR
jgi:hypothetical protein